MNNQVALTLELLRSAEENNDAIAQNEQELKLKRLLCFGVHHINVFDDAADEASLAEWLEDLGEGYHYCVADRYINRVFGRYRAADDIKTWEIAYGKAADAIFRDPACEHFCGKKREDCCQDCAEAKQIKCKEPKPVPRPNIQFIALVVACCVIAEPTPSKSYPYDIFLCSLFRDLLKRDHKAEAFLLWLLLIQLYIRAPHRFTSCANASNQGPLRLYNYYMNYIQNFSAESMHRSRISESAFAGLAQTQLEAYGFRLEKGQLLRDAIQFFNEDKDARETITGKLTALYYGLFEKEDAA